MRKTWHLTFAFGESQKTNQSKKQYRTAKSVKMSSILLIKFLLRLNHNTTLIKLPGARIISRKSEISSIKNMMTFLLRFWYISKSIGAILMKRWRNLETSQEAIRETLTKIRNKKLFFPKPPKIFTLVFGWIFKLNPNKATKGFNLNHLRQEFLDRMPHHTLLLDVCGPVLIIYRVPKTLKSQMSYVSVELFTQECFNIQRFHFLALNGWWDQSNQ